jgi:type I restriction enzyme, R subunit
LSPAVYESDVEEFALIQFAAIGYECLHGDDIAPETLASERESFGDVILRGRLEESLRRLNPEVPEAAIADALRKVILPASASPIQSNRAFHRLLRDGVEVEVAGQDSFAGEIRGLRLKLIDFNDPGENDWLVVNQFTVIEGHHHRRPDIVVFVNGLPLAVFELKNTADEDATVEDAYNQIETYKKQIPSLFTCNELVILSDFTTALAGTLTAPLPRFAPWRTVEGQEVAPAAEPQLITLIKGMFEKRRFLELIRSFIVFEDERTGTVKKLAGYHQFGAVREALAQTVRATRSGGDRKVGVVWHTQGSGKSLTMAFYAGRIVDEPAMENPTIVVITDRNDLDDQLFNTFSRCAELIRNTPVQARDREHLRELLAVASGGVVFTTIQKFFPEGRGEKFPELSARRNIVVIADEAHRTQYGLKSKLVRDKTGGGYLVPGFAQHMRDALPNASYIGFTGTPIELTDRNTRAVFGEYISTYDMARAVEDGAIVPIYYESRLVKLSLDADQRSVIDDEFEEVTEQEEASRKERLKSRWAALEAVVGDDKRVRMIAEDIVQHFERRLEGMRGKAMIVCMSRRICVAMYEAIRVLRPTWHAEPGQEANDLGGEMKVVMTGSAADPPDWQDHIRNKMRLEKIADRFRAPDDPLKLVIVRDMWLTGFDAPSMHTLYVDKPMQGHGLMQAIARVNRVWGDKPGGLVVDYLGLGDNLRKAMITYSEAGGRGKTAIPQAEAVATMLEKLEACRDFFHSFDYGKFLHGNRFERLKVIPPALEHVYATEDGRDRIVELVASLEQAFGLALGTDEAMIARDEVAFFQTIKAGVLKSSVAAAGRSRIDVETALRQLVSKAIVAEGVIDIFEAAGLKKPNVGILSEEFLAEIRGLPQKNLALELLRKLLHDDLKIRRKKNLIQFEAFSEKLEKTIQRYRNRAIETVEVIEELIGLAKELQTTRKHGRDLELTDDEQAFYDALGTNDSAVAVLGDQVLARIARELTRTIRQSVTLDWTAKESVQAKLRALVRRLLKNNGYPPDKTEQAIKTVLRQAEVIAADWTSSEPPQDMPESKLRALREVIEKDWQDPSHVLRVVELLIRDDDSMPRSVGLAEIQRMADAPDLRIALQIAEYLASERVGMLVARFLLLRGDEEAEPLPDEAVYDALQTGNLLDPQTDLAIEDWQARVVLSYEAAMLRRKGEA